MVPRVRNLSNGRPSVQRVRAELAHEAREGKLRAAIEDLVAAINLNDVLQQHVQVPGFEKVVVETWHIPSVAAAPPGAAGMLC